MPAHSLCANPPRDNTLAYARFLRSIDRVVWRVLGADTERDDVVQQVLLKVITHGASLRDPDKLNAWVQAITANTAKRRLAAARRRFALLLARHPDLFDSFTRQAQERSVPLRSHTVESPLVNVPLL